MIPHAMDLLPRWRQARARAGCMLVGTDFDGTLSPIVERPEQAAPLPAARRAVERLAQRGDTVVGVISGRALEDVRARLGVAGVYYAGNHGLEIEGPGLRRVHEAAAAARPRLRDCLAELRRELAGWDGVEVEDKGLSLTVHYRRVADAAAARRVAALAHAAAGARPELRSTSGRKVVNVLPAVDWDKGAALAFLLESLSLPARTAPVRFIGDDVTDEDAFRALRGRGDGVVVGDPPPEATAAAACLRSVDEVVRLLEALARDG